MEGGRRLEREEKENGWNKKQRKSYAGSRKAGAEMVATDCHFHRFQEGPSISSSQDDFCSVQLWEQIQTCP